MKRLIVLLIAVVILSGCTEEHKNPSPGFTSCKEFNYLLNKNVCLGPKEEKDTVAHIINSHSDINIKSGEILGDGYGEYNCIKNCPNATSLEGCEIGVCQRVVSSDGLIFYDDFDNEAYIFVNRAEEKRCAIVEINYTETIC